MQLMLQGSAKINTLPFTLRNKTITIHLKTGPVLLALQSFMITIKGPLHTRTIKRNSSEKCSIVLSVWFCDSIEKKLDFRTYQHSIDENLLEDAVPGQETGEDVLCEADLLSLPLEVSLTWVRQPALRGQADLLRVSAPLLAAGVTKLGQTKPEQRWGDTLITINAMSSGPVVQNLRSQFRCPRRRDRLNRSG